MATDPTSQDERVMTLYEGHPLAGPASMPHVPDAPDAPTADATTTPVSAAAEWPTSAQSDGAFPSAATGVTGSGVTSGPDSPPGAEELALRALVEQAFEAGWRQAWNVGWQQHGVRVPEATVADWRRWMPDLGVPDPGPSAGTSVGTNLAAGTRPMTATGAGQAG